MNPRKFIVVAIAFCVACPQALGSITYLIEPREGDFAPWSLDGGSITTDGTIGEISPLNFESWALRFSSPSGQSEISSADGGAFLFTTTFTRVDTPTTTSTPSLTATGDQLIANSAGGFLGLLFATQDIFSDDFTGNVVAFFPTPRFVNYVGGGSGGLLVDNTVDSSDPIGPLTIDPNVISGQANNPNRSTFDFPSGPLVIGSVASVPEPSSLRLVVVCFACLMFSRQSLTATKRRAI